MLLPAITAFSIPAAPERYADCARGHGRRRTDRQRRSGERQTARRAAGDQSGTESAEPEQFGIARERFFELRATMARQALASGSPGNNPRVPTEAEIIDLYETVWNQGEAMQTLGNLINNGPSPAAPKRACHRLQPGHRRARLYVSLSSADETREAIAALPRQPSMAGRRRRRWCARGSCSVSGTARKTSRRRCPADHQRAWQGVFRRPGRSDPRAGSGGVRLRHPASAQGRVFFQRRPRHRFEFADAAARCLRQDHPVQLPAMVPLWMLPVAHRLR